jgi:photosystem II stability/assembly factor-like uncharacterized protein
MKTNKDKRFLMGIAALLLSFTLVLVGCPMGTVYMIEENQLPVLTGSVTVSGIARVGRTLTANISDSNDNGAITYRWQSSDTEDGGYTDISGAASAQTYTLGAKDADKYIRVVVSRAGYDGTIFSVPVAPFLTWTVFDTAPSDVSTIVYSDNDRFAAVRDAGIIYSKEEGEPWAAGSDVPYYKGICDIASDGNGKVVVVSVEGGTAYSTDGGKTWSEGRHWSIDSSSIFRIAYGGGKFVVVPCLSSALAYSSDGGKTWETNGNIGLSLPIPVLSITYGNGNFVAVNHLGKTAYSPDGKNWTPGGNTGLSSTENTAHVEMTYGNGNFVAVNSKGKAAYSKDGGETWTAVEDTTFGSTDIRDIAYGGGMFVIVGDTGKAAYSEDGGETWTAANLNLEAVNVFGIAYGGGKFVAVGRNGKVAYSNKLE